MNYYNENDKHACAWLRELIKAKLIPDGKVDERSILDVQPNDLDGFVQCHFFAGIAGWSYALQLAGWQSTRPCWTMSCPCQPFSCAGKGLGEADERHLWPYGRNLIGECRPAIVFGEQVASPDGLKWLDGVSVDLERAGYAFGSSDLCAAGVAAPHQRQRLYWMADAKSHEWPRSERNRDKTRSGGLADGIESCSLEDAQSDGRNERRPECEGQQRQSASDGTSSIIALAIAGREQEHTTATQGLHADTGCGGAVGGVVQPSGTRRDVRQSTSEATGYGGAAEPAGGVSRMVNAERPGCEVARHDQHDHITDEIKETNRIGSAGNAWSRFDILHMLDGKSRRVESGTFPLAHGVPGRVAQLRGLGNAIVPACAAQFITAYLETL